MRAAMYYNNNDVRLQEVPRPKIGPGEMLVKVMASGICGSDVMEWYRIKKAPLVLGHEIAGEVVEAAPEVKRFKTGDRVFVSHHVPCNTCRFCMEGNHCACETLHTTNFDPGGFAEYVRCPRINVETGAFLLPAGMTWEEGTFIEPLGCTVRGLRSAHLRPGQSVLVLGSGVTGLLQVMTAKALGAGRIIATDVSDYRLARAREFGADATLRADEDVPARVRALNEGRLADLVIVCAGTLAAFKQALKSVERAGTVLCFATTEPGVDLPVPVNEFWRNAVTLLPSYAAAPYDLEVALELIRSGRVNAARLVTHRLGLAETGEGFKIMARGGESLKVIVEPQR